MTGRPERVSPRAARGDRSTFRRWFRLGLVFAALVTLASLPALRPGRLVPPASGQHPGTVEPGTADTEAEEQTAAPHGVAEHGATEPGATEHGATEPGATEHGATEHGATEHGAPHSEHPPELPNLITILYDRYPDAAWAQFLHTWENQAFMFLYIMVILVVAAAGSRALNRIPGPLQNGVEFVVESLDDFVTGILGPQGRRLVPFLGTLFVFILTMNYAGLVPFLKSPTANLNTTLAMALCVFFYVQWTGIRSFGIVGYLDHLAGSPRDLVGFILMPIMLPLHIVGELVKPMSLSLRLFGNVTGEDVLLAVFVGLGVGLLGAFVHGLPFGIPLQAIVYPLLLIFGFIQALVFTLLSTIYFFMMLPHEEHH